MSETSIDILINRTGINTITLLLPNNTLYEVGNITAIPDNYFQINYTKCITGKNIPNEFELTIITRTTSRIIDLSYFYLSYQKDTNNTNVEIIENKFLIIKFLQYHMNQIIHI